MSTKNYNATIDLAKTGEQLKTLRTKNGYTVADLQSALGLRCPQSIYNWQQGKSLPSAENLLVLSRLFSVPINEILVSSVQEISPTSWE